MAQERLTNSDSCKSALTARIVSGSIGSLITSLVVTPFDVVKVRQQAASAESIVPPSLPPNVQPCPRGCGTFVLHNGHLDCVLPKSAVPFFDNTGHLTHEARASYAEASARNQLGTFAMLRRIFVQEGFGGIYAGLRPTLAMALPNTVLYFTAYDEIFWRLHERSSTSSLSTENKVPTWLPIIAGGGARLVASTATSPLELLRTRQAAAIGDNQTQRTLWKEFQVLVSEQGVGALYQGLRPTLWRDVPFSAIYWLCLERFREMWKASGSVGLEVSPMEQAGQAFVNGAVAGMIAAACTTPFDVVKTRQQAVIMQQSLAGCHHNGAVAYNHHAERTTFVQIREIIKREGVEALWSGNQARMLRVAPACAIMISSYELGKRLLAS